MLLLFDVDGTLILTSRAGAKAMQEAGKRVVGEHFTLEGIEFAGRLDPLIWEDGARRAGVAGNDGVRRRFRAAYAEALTRRLAVPGTAYQLPGVAALLDALEARPDVTLGLLTGNYPETGAIKLRAAGLDPDRFPVRAWGVDGPDRRALPRVAMTRYADRNGHAIDPAAVVVVGDTIHDIDCAHANGCVAVGVATGPSYDRTALAAHGPELLLDDLTDAGAFLRFLDARRS